MNIFFLSRSPDLAAVYHCDKHVVKMTIEAAQIISTVLIQQGYPSNPTKKTTWTYGTIGYKPTHINHPCVKWAGSTQANLAWVWQYFTQLCIQYTLRYNRVHLAEIKLCAIQHLRPSVSWSQYTDPAQAMPDCYKQSNPVQAYRDYYKNEKSRFAKWEKIGNIPYWW